MAKSSTAATYPDSIPDDVFLNRSGPDVTNMIYLPLISQ
jgi:hypothetical protein